MSAIEKTGHFNIPCKLFCKIAHSTICKLKDKMLIFAFHET